MSFFDAEPRRSAGRFNFSLEPLLGITPFVALHAEADANLTLTTSRQDISNCVLTLRHTGVWVVQGAVDFSGLGSGDNGQRGAMVLTVDGAEQALQGVAMLTIAGNNNRSMGVATWVVRKTALGPTALVLRAYKTGGSGTSLVQGPGRTAITAFTVPGSETLLT